MSGTGATGCRTVFPKANESWKRRLPAEMGVDADGLQDAVEFAVANEISWPRDIARGHVSDDAPDLAAKLGPFRDRGGPCGLVLKDGFIIAEWGDLARVDLTYSATKSYVATVAGLACDRDLIASVDDPVAGYEVGSSISYAPQSMVAIEKLAADGQRAQISTENDGAAIDGFQTRHNGGITWRHLLQQTSEWQGWLFGKPDTVDWNRSGAFGTETTREERKAPGSHWEYNDVRVNRVALCLLAVWKESLPVILKREIMDSIGASDTWEWHGYGDCSTVIVDGDEVESVSGGAHWGGGLWINTYDHARFGLLFLNDGVWEGKRLISAEWLQAMTEPCSLNPSYGFMWWLNTGHERYGDAASARTFAASGAGGNSVVCDPERNTVVVTRWCEDVAGVVNRVARAC